MRRIAFTAMALLATTAGAGCQTLGPAANVASGRARPAPADDAMGYWYSGGRALQIYSRPPAAVQPAVLAAFDDLRIRVSRQSRDNASVSFEGSTADDRKATITLRPQGTGSRLTARIGWFGDEPLSHAFMDRVAIRLGELPPAPIPETPPSEPAHNPYFTRTAVSDAESFNEIAEGLYGSHSSP